MAATTFVGQNYGAGKTDRVKKSMWVTLGMGVGYTVLTGVLLLAFRTPSCSCSPMMREVVAFGCTAMHYFCPFYWELSILHSLSGHGARARQDRSAHGGAAGFPLRVPHRVDPVGAALLPLHRWHLRPLPGVVGARRGADHPFTMESKLAGNLKHSGKTCQKTLPK